MNEDGVSSYAAGPAGMVKELSFGLADLPAVREFAADQALRRGMPQGMVGDFLVALNEVATNAVTHGATKGTLRLWKEGPCLVAELHDEGTDWRLLGEPGHTPPAENATSGMGLWVARKLSETLRVVTGGQGTTVTMRFSVPPPFRPTDAAGSGHAAAGRFPASTLRPPVRRQPPYSSSGSRS